MERKKTTSKTPSKTPPKKRGPKPVKNTPENFFKVLQLIEYEGLSARKAMERIDVDSKQFYDWIDSDELNRKQYTRAREERADLIFEEMKELADKQDKDIFVDADGNERTNHNVIHRNKLQIDTRKWMLSKMQPKKYGDKLDITSDHEKLNQVAQHIPTEIIQQIADKL